MRRVDGVRHEDLDLLHTRERPIAGPPLSVSVRYSDPGPVTFVSVWDGGPHLSP